MLDFVSSQPINGLPYYRTEHSLLALPNAREDFVRAAATFFVQKWMSSLPEMLNVWQHWDTTSPDEKQAYRLNLDHLCKNGTVIDNPPGVKGETGPMGTFSETMLRWFREHAQPILTEPDVPVPSAHGNIDLIEITGKSGDYASMQLTMWEAKSSDSQISSHTKDLYDQLDSY